MARVQVALRIRPMSAAELAAGARTIAHRRDEQVVVLEDPSDAPRASCSREQSYVFDVAFDPTATQETVYRATTHGLVTGVISGCNATIFTYGPTGCGKTYTMLGTDGEPGICVRALGELFQAIEDTSGDTEYRITMSYLEIYNEMIRDLLNPSRGHLQLWEDAGGTVRVAGITEIPASSAQEVTQLLARGNRQRTQEPTATNRSSSRSHAVLQLTVSRWHRGRGLCRGRGLSRGHLFMADLAGSERAAQTQNRGQRMKEGAHINRSLLALGNCIKALSGQASSKYINYRDSKLTRLLKGSLGGSSRTVMIAHISPASTAFHESRSTLAYAHRARSIRTAAEPVRRSRQRQRPEEAPRHRGSSAEPREVLALLCRLPRLELGSRLQGALRHRALCARIIRQQRELMAEHRLPVPRPLRELYETWELAGHGGDTGTGWGGPGLGTSLPRIPQASGTESSPVSERDGVRARSREHGTCRDPLPPPRPEGVRHGWVLPPRPVQGAKGKGGPLSGSTPPPVLGKPPRAQQRRSEAALGDPRGWRRPRSLEVTGCGLPAHRPPPRPPRTLQSRSEHPVPAGMDPSGAPPAAKPPQSPRPRLGGVTGKGARAPGKDGRSHRY